ncbi:hypothetical protein AB3S75_039891 [Citrus x aurantiifolia]
MEMTSQFDIGKRAAVDSAPPSSKSSSNAEAFRTGGRVLDPHRCSLSTRTVEALICTQNWLRSTPINLDEAIDEIEHIETEILGADKNIFDEA